MRLCEDGIAGEVIVRQLMRSMTIHGNGFASFYGHVIFWFDCYCRTATALACNRYARCGTKKYKSRKSCRVSSMLAVAATFYGWTFSALHRAAIECVHVCVRCMYTGWTLVVSCEVIQIGIFAMRITRTDGEQLISNVSLASTIICNLICIFVWSPSPSYFFNNQLQNLRLTFDNPPTSHIRAMP